MTQNSLENISMGVKLAWQILVRIPSRGMGEGHPSVGHKQPHTHTHTL